MKQPTPFHVAIRLNAVDEENIGPRFYMVLWHTESDIVVQVSYAEQDVLELDGTKDLTGYDDEGMKLVKVPAKHIQEWYTEEEIGDIDAMYHADMQLLSYAR